MDEKLSQALDLSNYITTFNNKKRLLWEKYQDDLLFYVNGHEITIDPTLITLCQCFVQKNIDRTVLIDSNNLPFEIEDLCQFLTDIMDQYAQASNKYFIEYNKLKTSRSIEKVVDL